jgi:hypothetical protein
MARRTRGASRQIGAGSAWLGGEQAMTLNFERLKEIYGEA